MIAWNVRVARPIATGIATGRAITVAPPTPRPSRSSTSPSTWVAVSRAVAAGATVVARPGAAWSWARAAASPPRPSTAVSASVATRRWRRPAVVVLRGMGATMSTPCATRQGPDDPGNRDASCEIHSAGGGTATHLRPSQGGLRTVAPVSQAWALPGRELGE